MNVCRLAAFAVLLCLAAPAPGFADPPLGIVAAENFYGDIAAQIGGPEVRVTSILETPDQDPHLFETSPSVARAVAQATIVIYNGLDYDPWMQTLLAATPNPARTALDVATLAGARPGSNPHLWYKTDAIRTLADALCDRLSRADPAQRDAFAARRDRLDAALSGLDAKLAALRTAFADTPVTATEPVFGYVFEALGWPVRNARFQLAVMNDTEPSPSDIAAFETDLKDDRVKLLVYNSQAANATARHMVDVAKAAHVPVLGVTETKPAAVAYQDWVAGEIDAIDAALRRAKRP